MLAKVFYIFSFLFEHQKRLEVELPGGEKLAESRSEISGEKQEYLNVDTIYLFERQYRQKLREQLQSNMRDTRDLTVQLILVLAVAQSQMKQYKNVTQARGVVSTRKQITMVSSNLVIFISRLCAFFVSLISSGTCDIKLMPMENCSTGFDLNKCLLVIPLNLIIMTTFIVTIPIFGMTCIMVAYRIIQADQKLSKS